ncbi:SDR family oxidoreductase [Beijerinckia indica]|uniref:Short-chain dehydrogenase/reductase SDR n=1 Tax=Beijerinckia indica subsp. indica (strain ATCC 9039 / DSM 1715 / NCIMB 8712) TaxID=395963 RepID=B2ILN5_BEII9|nr:SDR family oxidoreductase [Beijerinckia indica]ACB97435.1 short-chain dehydrogenase/reductase SDR [Beijerinckia indica subsp. indica ATCC 9039]
MTDRIDALGFGRRSTAEQVTEGVDLSGRTILLTGCNSGIGMETMRVLAARSARIVAVARNEEKARGALASAGAADGLAIGAEFTDLASVARAADQVLASGVVLDTIITNAAIMALPKLETVNGIEKQFLVNHVAHHLLVTRLLPAIRRSSAGRIVVVASNSHNFAPRGKGIDFDNLDGGKSYGGFRFYGQAKLANILFANELSRRLANDGITANALHPGLIGATGLHRHMRGPIDWAVSIAMMFGKTVPQGAATTCLLAAHPALEGISGRYFADCRAAKSSAFARDAGLARRLWGRTEEIIASFGVA